MSNEMPTPPASSVAPSSVTCPLPRPRRHPLKPGGHKETDLILYMDNGLNKVQLRVDNRGQKAGVAGVDVDGYVHFGEVERDLEALVDVIWVSGSPNLQIPYLLNIARLVTEYVPLFPASPRATLRFLDKLDAAFSSLLVGCDAETGDFLPGFENGRTISTTDKVRLKSIVDRTRLVVVRKLGEDYVDEEGDAMAVEEDDTVRRRSSEQKQVQETVHFEGFDNDDIEDEEYDEALETRIAKVYEKSIGELGDLMGGAPIGMISDD